MIKRFLLILCFCFALVGFVNPTKAKADDINYPDIFITWDESAFICWSYNPNSSTPWVLIGCQDEPYLEYSNNNYYFVNARYVGYYYAYSNGGWDPAPPSAAGYGYNLYRGHSTSSRWAYHTSGTTIIPIYGHFTTNDDSNIVPLPTPEELPWYKKIWDSIGDYINNPPWGENNIFDTLSDIWNVFTNSDDNPNTHISYDIVKQLTPTPFPTATPLPTQIPYTTLLKPDSNGNLVLNYLYNNPQGTPTESPFNPNGNNSNGNGNNYYIPDKNNPLPVEVYPKENMMPYAYNQNEFSIDNIDDYTDGFTQPLDEYIEDVPDVLSVFSLIPDELYIVIGCISCIPLVAGIIKAFMK